MSDEQPEKDDDTKRSPSKRSTKTEVKSEPVDPNVYPDPDHPMRGGGPMVYHDPNRIPHPSEGVPPDA